MDPISRGGNCQKVAAHILHPPVDLIMVNNNMVNSIGRVPRPTYRDIFFSTFFPALRIHQHWYLKSVCLSILQLKFMFVTFFKSYIKSSFSQVCLLLNKLFIGHLTINLYMHITCYISSL